MADTHINAFFADVDDKQKLFERAGSELQAAKDRLEAKKAEVGYVETVVAKEVVEPEPAKDADKKKK